MDIVHDHRRGCASGLSLKFSSPALRNCVLIRESETSGLRASYFHELYVSDHTCVG